MDATEALGGPVSEGGSERVTGICTNTKDLYKQDRQSRQGKRQGGRGWGSHRTLLAGGSAGTCRHIHFDWCGLYSCSSSSTSCSEVGPSSVQKSPEDMPNA
jgi:hypothetical protein